MKKTPSFMEWLDEGRRLGYASEAFCAMHEMTPMSTPEHQAFADGDEPCLVCVRVHP